MGLAPIPSRMLHDTAVFHVVAGMDRYQEKTYDDYTVKHVHLQSSSDVIKAPDDTEVQLKGLLFVDCKKSVPQLDLYALQQASLAAGDTMRADVYDASGTLVGNYAVLIVDGAPDVPATRTHHWELSLV
jgi:hypothetical protein